MQACAARLWLQWSLLRSGDCSGTGWMLGAVHSMGSKWRRRACSLPSSMVHTGPPSLIGPRCAIAATPPREMLLTKGIIVQNEHRPAGHHGQ